MWNQKYSICTVVGVNGSNPSIQWLGVYNPMSDRDEMMICDRFIYDSHKITVKCTRDGLIWGHFILISNLLSKWKRTPPPDYESSEHIIWGFILFFTAVNCITTTTLYIHSYTYWVRLGDDSAPSSHSKKGRVDETASEQDPFFCSFFQLSQQSRRGASEKASRSVLDVRGTSVFFNGEKCHPTDWRKGKHEVVVVKEEDKWPYNCWQNGASIGPRMEWLLAMIVPEMSRIFSICEEK